MRVAVISNRNRPGYPDENLKDHLAWTQKAASAGARLILFPELSLSGYSTQSFVRRLGMGLDSPRCTALIRAAQSHDVYIAFGMPLRLRRQLYISQVLVGPRGLIGHYEKIHLAGPVRGEGKVFKPGSRFRVFDLDGVGVGINICYDGRHPGSSLATAHLGAEVILHPHGNTVGHPRAEPARLDPEQEGLSGATRRGYVYLHTDLQLGRQCGRPCGDRVQVQRRRPCAGSRRKFRRTFPLRIATAIHDRHRPRPGRTPTTARQQRDRATSRRRIQPGACRVAIDRVRRGMQHGVPVLALVALHEGADLGAKHGDVLY